MKKNTEDSPRFPEFYKKNNPEWTDEQCKYKAKWFRKSCNYLSKEYYERNYPELSIEERENLRKENLKKSRENNKSHFEYWEKHYPELSKEEQENLWHEFTKTTNYQCPEYYIKRGYSEEDAKKECNKRIKIAGEKISKKVSGELNGMHSSKRTEQQLKENCPWAKEFYIKHYPNLSKEKREELRKEVIQRSQDNAICNTTIEYYLNKGMSEEEAKYALKERQATFSLEKCIKKYGEIEGLKRFSERQQKWLKSLQKNFEKNGDSRTPQSKFANEIITECCKILNIRKPNKEKYIYDNVKHRAYAYDFQYNNKIIEFQGDYWHCNPILYDENFINKVKQKTAKEIWQFDKEKKECAERYNYDVLYIWEYDYNINKNEIIKKCIDFLTND